MKSVFFLLMFALIHSYFITLSFSFLIFKQLYIKRKFHASSDISPLYNKLIKKRILRHGSLSSFFPRPGDRVEVKWDIFLSNNTYIHSSTNLENTFDFEVDKSPSQVILGWDIAIKSMRVGEIAELLIDSEYGFGQRGVPNLIPPNETIKCILELVKIAPDLEKVYESIEENESITQDLANKVTHGKFYPDEHVSPIRGGMSLHPPTSSSTSKHIKYFDSKVHHTDVNEAISGQGLGYKWTESQDGIELELDLNRLLLLSLTNRDSKVDSLMTDKLLYGMNKDNLEVQLSSDYLRVLYVFPRSEVLEVQNEKSSHSTNVTLLEGRLHGCILPSNSAWMLVTHQDSSVAVAVAADRGLSLEVTGMSRGAGGESYLGEWQDVSRIGRSLHVPRNVLEVSMEKKGDSQGIWCTVFKHRQTN